jgi:Kef-type K+ transport system membrane component KefB
MLGSVESFASLFVPFYFFDAGLRLRPEDFGLEALGIGLLFGLAGITLRVVPIWLQRRLVFGEGFRKSLLVGVPLLPTLVFTLVIAGILRERHDIGPGLFGGLVVYALLNSLFPGLVLRRSLPEVEDELLREELLPFPETGKAGVDLALEPPAPRAAGPDLHGPRTGLSGP